MENSCPDCHTSSVSSRFTLHGLLYGIFCFPCGIYCCLKKRQRFCSSCHCEVITTQPSGLSSMGYNFRSYQTSLDGLSVEKATGYRNAALSVMTNTTSECSSNEIYGSQTELVQKEPV